MKEMTNIILIYKEILKMLYKITNMLIIIKGKNKLKFLVIKINYLMMTIGHKKI